ncbi:MAG TPA: type II toxin-antitoxin system VapC family toxin [Caulobacteraceae bacterium]
MIGLDTNVLLRYLTRDDPIQFSAAVRVIEEQLSVRERGFVSTIVLAELAWVLRRSYRWPVSQVAEMMERLLEADVLVIEHADEVSEAITVVRDGRGDFADALIGAVAGRAGCSHTLTFDRDALRLPGFAPV